MFQSVLLPWRFQFYGESLNQVTIGVGGKTFCFLLRPMASVYTNQADIFILLVSTNDSAVSLLILVIALMELLFY